MFFFLPRGVHGEVEAVLVDVVVHPQEVLKEVTDRLAMLISCLWDMLFSQ